MCRHLDGDASRRRAGRRRACARASASPAKPLDRRDAARAARRSRSGSTARCRAAGRRPRDRTCRRSGASRRGRRRASCALRAERRADRALRRSACSPVWYALPRNVSGAQPSRSPRRFRLRDERARRRRRAPRAASRCTTCFPASSAARTIAACTAGGVRLRTRSTASSASRSSNVDARRPCVSANAHAPPRRDPCTRRAASRGMPAIGHVARAIIRIRRRRPGRGFTRQLPHGAKRALDRGERLVADLVLLDDEPLGAGRDRGGDEPVVADDAVADGNVVARFAVGVVLHVHGRAPPGGGRQLGCGVGAGDQAQPRSSSSQSRSAGSARRRSRNVPPSGEGSSSLQ